MRRLLTLVLILAAALTLGMTAVGAVPLHECPAGWSSDPCEVPADLEGHLRAELGDDQGVAAVAAVEGS